MYYRKTFMSRTVLCLRSLRDQRRWVLIAMSRSARSWWTQPLTLRGPLSLSQGGIDCARQRRSNGAVWNRHRRITARVVSPRSSHMTSLSRFNLESSRSLRCEVSGSSLQGWTLLDAKFMPIVSAALRNSRVDRDLLGDWELKAVRDTARWSSIGSLWCKPSTTRLQL